MRNLDDIAKQGKEIFENMMRHDYQEIASEHWKYAEWARTLAAFFCVATGMDARLHDQCERLYEAAEEMADFLDHQAELCIERTQKERKRGEV